MKWVIDMPVATSHWGKSARIVGGLRSRIVRGEWKPGERLPTRVELGKTFGTSAATIQKALDVLLADRVVVAYGRRGTFVSENPPHRSRIGVVFPCDPADSKEWRRMYAAVDDAARRLIREDNYDLKMYYGTEEPEAADKRALVEDVAADRLAGIFAMAMPLDCFDDTPLLGHPYLRVATTTKTIENDITNVRCADFMTTALAGLREAGRQRVAMVYSPQEGDAPEALAATVSAHGMTTHANWCLPVWPGEPRAARSGAYLLMRLPEAERPDAIIVADDYLAEQTTLGVLDAGVQAPQDVTVVVRCNFPHLPPAATPVTRIGMDWYHLLRRTVDALLADEPPKVLDVSVDTEDNWRCRQLAHAVVTA